MFSQVGSIGVEGVERLTKNAERAILYRRRAHASPSSDHLLAAATLTRNAQRCARSPVCKVYLYIYESAIYRYTLDTRERARRCTLRVILVAAIILPYRYRADSRTMCLDYIYAPRCSFIISIFEGRS